jgi:hypothetical protein
VVADVYLNDAAPAAGVRVAPAPGLLSRSRLARHLLFALSRLAPDERAGRDMAALRREWDAWSAEIAERFPPGRGDPRTDVGAFNALVRRSVADWGSAWAEGAWRRMTPVLREMKRQADVNGFDLVFVVFPVREQVDAIFVPDFPQQRLAAVAREIGVPVLDLLPLLRRAARDSPQPIFYDRCHPTPYGNRLIAPWILDFVRSRLAERGGAGR